MSKLNQFTNAAILVKQNEDLVVDKIRLPGELKVGQVLVELSVSGICGSQIGEIIGNKGKDNYLPHLLGHEGCGTVLEIGPGVKTVSKGDQVVLHWRKGAGIQSEPPKYCWRNKNLNAGWVTTFNKHAVISENRCTKVPNKTNRDLTALLGCAITTGFGVIENNAEVKMGESVVVYGSGGIGLNILQASRLYSAFPIIAVDLFDSRLNLAKNFGATHIINARVDNPKTEILKILKSKELNVFIDNTGVPEVIELGYEMINSNGRVVLVGVPKFDKDIKIHTLPLHFGKSIIGSHGGDSNPDSDIARYLNLHSNKIFSLDGLVTNKYRLKDINVAIKSMKEGKSIGRILINL